ncbi:MAG: carbamoyl phosphate synthase small subunit, partial [Halobacteria archaeon]|nr:carbamoyl phosphate synthase small subunit [Halobacteria archaeon]
MTNEDDEMKAYLALEDGTVVEGEGHGVPGEVQGELVFTTQYTGYEESLTDPSYAFQMLMFTYPLIGNYGVNSDHFQSDEIQAEACIAREFSTDPDDVLEWFRDEEIPAMSGVDTRALTIKTREHGTMRAGLVVGEDATEEKARELVDDCPYIEELDLGAQVTRDEAEVFEGFGDEPGDGERVVLIDCGCKQNIITSLRRRNMDVVAVPYDASPGEIRDYDPDSLFVSNGPGDPANYPDAVNAIQKFTGEIPVSGVCLGHQLISRAFGAETYKLKFGHRGANQPV